MKYLFLLLIFLSLSIGSYAQPDNIKRIMGKAKAGQTLTESDMAALKTWGEDMRKQAEGKSGSAVLQSTKSGAKRNDCPAIKTTPLNLAELTRESYIALAKGLITIYGPKSGDLPGLKSLLETAKKPGDGSDMGALFMFEGAGSASVYVTSWSAVKQPDDILTANNLGVVLKDMGEYTKALQVLKYADKLKPNIGLVICNMGWVYHEMGYPANAKLMFEKALRVAPEMTTPYLGLGLMAKCEGNNMKAEEYLRKALANNYSAVGFAAYKQAKASQQAGNEGGEQSKPLSSEKGSAGDVQIPGMPFYEQKEKTASQKTVVLNYMSRLDGRVKQLLNDVNSTLVVVQKQQEHAIKNPDNSIVFNRDFAKELMQLQDVTELLFGESSNYGKAIKDGSKIMEQNGAVLEKDMPALMQHSEKTGRLMEQMTKLIEEMAACGDNDICKHKVQVKIDQTKYEGDQEEYQVCVLSKGEMDITYAATCKAYKNEYNELKEAVQDYYAFTNPILEKIYAPSFNELMNLYREMFVLTHEKAVVGIGSGLPDMAKQYNELKCVEPKPPIGPEPVPEDSNLPEKKEKECPLGKGISRGIGALSFELDCDHVKLSGGEGVLWSVKRDFNKHETTIWGGVGAKGEYGNGNVTGEATVGVEVTIGQGDVIKDLAVTSSVKAGLGGLIEGEISGRMAVEGGPSIDSNAGFITPELPAMGK